MRIAFALLALLNIVIVLAAPVPSPPGSAHSSPPPSPPIPGTHYHPHAPADAEHQPHDKCPHHQGHDGSKYVCDNKLLGPVDLHAQGNSYWTELFVNFGTPNHRFGGRTADKFLEDFYDFNAKQWKYPHNDGFHKGTTHLVEIHEGSYGGILDRFGSEYGAYLAPLGTKWEQRAMPPSSLDTPPNAPRFNYHRYKITGKFKAHVGKILPGFGQDGGGEQIMLPKGKKVKDLIAAKILTEIHMSRTPSPAGSPKSLGSHKSLKSDDSGNKNGRPEK